MSVIFTLTSCFVKGGGLKGFYEPVSLGIKVPEGPPTFMAGWHAGCRTGLALKAFQNSFVYRPDYGNGVYQEDVNFQRGWGLGYFSCTLHTAGFIQGAFPGYGFHPLQR